jgi:peptidylprolyl isomerase
MRTRALLPTALAAAAIALGACGEDEQESGSTPPPATTAQAPATSTAQALAEQVGEARRPRIPRPAGAPPATLEQADIRRGRGRPVREGDLVRVQYAGASWSTGEEFDASYERGEPFEFQLGAGMVIPGWDQGVQGMRVGGRRLLVIPPDLGYGAQGSPPVIAPNETLVFVVDAAGRRPGQG